MVNNENIHISDNRRIFEIVAVLITGLGKFVFMDYLDVKFVFIAVTIIFWGVYIGLRGKSVKYMMKYWGFRTDNLKEAIRMVLPFGILSVTIFVIIGLIQGTINPTWHIFPILLIYPIWGVIQQFLIIGLVAGNLQDLRMVKLSRVAIITLTAIVFGVLHYPNEWLVIGTFLLALFYGYVYLKVRNIWILGLFHGWLGGLFYYTVVNRDPFLEVFVNL
ncbi:CPBP family intramembrane metalloprotease [bacterium]|nr:CPBP family intramembrane metalloprotease [bacterium]